MATDMADSPVHGVSRWLGAKHSSKARGLTGCAAGHPGRPPDAQGISGPAANRKRQCHAV